jgi:hypothetical protein
MDIYACVRAFVSAWIIVVTFEDCSCSGKTKRHEANWYTQEVRLLCFPMRRGSAVGISTG